MAGKILIGTSGYDYPHWSGVFYPDDLPHARRLPFYAEHFRTVEINRSFYSLPSEKAAAKWAAHVPARFTFAFKASRYITHMKKLKSCPDALERMFKVADALGKKLGPVLFQLPPHWRANPERLSEFIKLLPAGHRYVFEFRDPSWYSDAVFRVLDEAGVGFCIHDMAGSASPILATGRLAYLRFHGSGTIYGGRYDRKELALWAKRIRRFARRGLDVFVYFNNDAHGYAVINARELMAMLKV